ncbi:MAG: ABC transporter permease [Coriobacteriales bacterium]|jgi:ABC-2 type transport system permease protein|nr:ABC transporter permease [Coriobacteriales bacterium]
MRNTLALARRILQQFSHDPRTVVLFLVAPVVALWLFSVMLGSPDYEPRLAAVDLSDEVVTALESETPYVTVYTTGEAGAAQGALEKREVDAVLTIRDETLVVQVEGTDSSKTAASAEAVQAAVRQVASDERDQLSEDFADTFAEMKTQLAPLGISVEEPQINLSISEIEIAYLHGDAGWTLFDFIGPVFLTIFIFVFVFITSGMSLVTERTGGTMERLLATPIASWQLVAGYALGFGAVSLVQAGVVLWACLVLIGFPNVGALPLVFLLTFSTALASLTLGLLVSGLAKTGFQVIQLMLLFVVPQILLSGLFDLSQAPVWMKVLSACFPVTHAAEALRDIMLRGSDLAAFGPDLAILWGFIALFFLGATASFNLRRSKG